MEQRLHKAIFITPLETPTGVKIKKHLGLVRATIVDTIPPHHDILTLLSSARRRRSPISRFISSLHHEAIRKLEENARKLGANAVLGVRIETVYLGWNRVLVYAYGTAAEVE